MPRWSICTVEAHPIREGKDTEVYGQRRRIKTEEKAKVVAVVWGEDIIQFLATLDILSRKIRAGNSLIRSLLILLKSNE